MSQFDKYIKIAQEMLFEEEKKEVTETEEMESEEAEETEDESSESSETETSEDDEEEVAKTISIEKIQKDFEGQTEIPVEQFFKKYKNLFMPIVKKLSKKGK